MGRKSIAHERRDQIVWALFDCLAEKGQEKVTVKVIAAQAKLSPGVIHHYFKSKDEIVSILAEAIIEKYSNMFYSRLAKASSSEQRVDFLIDFLVDIIFDRPLNRTFYNLIQMSLEREQLRKVMQTMLKNYREELSGAILEVGAQDSPLLGAELLAVTEGITVQLLVDPRVLKRADVRQLITKAAKGAIFSP